MRPVSPVIPITDVPEIKVAEHQKEYRTLPVAECGDENGTVVCRWHLEEHEREEFLRNGDIFVYIWTFGRLFNPMLLTTQCPEVEFYDKEGDKI
jgi:hypothetical protein